MSATRGASPLPPFTGPLTIPILPMKIPMQIQLRTGWDGSLLLYKLIFERDAKEERDITDRKISPEKSSILQLLLPVDNSDESSSGTRKKIKFVASLLARGSKETVAGETPIPEADIKGYTERGSKALLEKVRGEVFPLFNKKTIHPKTVEFHVTPLEKSGYRLLIKLVETESRYVALQVLVTATMLRRLAGEADASSSSSSVSSAPVAAASS